MNKKRLGSTVVFMLIIPLLTVFIFIYVMHFWSIADVNVPTLKTTKKNISIRGNIISEDGFILAHSKKMHKITIDTRSIDKNKLDIFINLYSIYTNENKKKLKKLLNSKKGSIVLSFNTDTKTANDLKYLSKRLNQKKVFIPFEIKENVYSPAIDIDVLQSGENRTYAANDALSPILGYIQKNEIDNITRTRGVKGIEKYYDYYLSNYQNDVIRGNRDIGNNIILDKSSLIKKQEDGYDVVLNIPLKLQKKLEIMLNEKAKLYDAKEIVIGIIDSKTKDVLSLATSRRYNPSAINKNDYKALNSTAIEYLYEPGSVMKPIIFSIMYENKKINLDETINTHNGILRLGKQIIRDTHSKKEMNVKDIIIYSSNIGMAELSNRIDGVALTQGLNNFKFSRKTGIDLPYEHKGNMQLLNNKTHKTSISYGYAINTTFIQLLNAYTVFNDDGYISSPRVLKYLKKNKQIYKINKTQKEQVISKNTAEVMKNILIDTVQKGTGRATRTNGLIIGGKTGTAKIAKGGAYSNLYNSSFFGFANDDNKSYTIGVLVIEPKSGSYYASQTALPIFKDVIEILIKNKYLSPSKTNQTNFINDKNLEDIFD